ncbi:MAG: hypothetical protein HY674_04030 [Chloroflexi bacterium]|nr:hypothetical protein [Chloroflexota bacterium]
MKSSLIKRLAQTIGVTMALALLTSFTPQVRAGETVSTKGATKLLQLNPGGQILMQWHPLGPKAQTNADQAKKVISMSCAKCTSVPVTHVNIQKGHVKTSIVSEKHLCPGCQTAIVVTGFGKGKKLVPVHTCKDCGDDSLYCCATTAGAKPTRGMEKN